MKVAALKFLALMILALPLAASSQSSDQNFPTAVTSNEITGVVKARDMGDARLTTYYYEFNGVQGDIFVNVLSRNFTGDIDIFNAEGMRPLTKMVIYADSGVSETGRLLYLRKSERLLLRIQGRSPNDDVATFQIKFGGSFRAAVEKESPGVPTVGRTDERSPSRVNSVGTILPAAPTPPPANRVDSASSASEEDPKDKPKTERVNISSVEPVKPSGDTDSKTVFENKSAKVTTTTKVSKPPLNRASARAKAASTAATKPVEEKKPDPLASIRLIVQMKDGEIIERTMNEVVRFSVDKGILTVIGKGGKVSKYSILDVAKLTIE